jgi:nucleotide-binding universal stress UspA family protein
LADLWRSCRRTVGEHPVALAVDGSRYAQRAAEIVRRLADGGDDVVVPNVTEIMPVYGGTTADLDLDRAGVEAARRFGSELEQAGVPVKVELVRAFVGHVAKLIVDAAREHGAGMIVLGSRGRNDLTALLLGSVAHKVIHLADCPVMVAR